MRPYGLSVSCLLLPLLAACGASSTTSMVAPTGGRCAVSVQASAATIGSGGGTGAITVDTARECQWTATAEVPWLTLMSSTSGQGAGSLTFSAAPNLTLAIRVGNIAVNGQRVEIAQEAGTCAISVAPTTLSTGAAGGDLHVAVTTQELCSWTASSRDSWIVIASNDKGTGTSEVTVRATANTGPARTGTIDIGGRSVIVSQDAAGAGATCVYAISPTSFSPAAAGGSSTVAVTTTAGCTWTTTGAPAWITVTGGSGTGNGSVIVAAVVNTGAARTATLTIAGQIFVVTQAAAAGTTCTYAINPTAVSPTAAGGSTTVAVTTTPGCAWTTSGAPAWLTVTGGSGTGNGSVTVAVAANTGPVRTATLTIAGQSLTVTQAAGPATCAYSINPISFSPAAAGGSTVVAVTTTAACNWTTSGAPAWMTVTGGSGAGNGSVTVAADANTGAARSATLTIAGQSFTVTQAAAACSFTVSPTSIQVKDASTTKKINVTTASHCSWTASITSGSTWLTIASGSSDTGNGTVEISIARNLDPPRTGTLLVAGTVVTVNQDAK